MKTIYDHLQYWVNQQPEQPLFCFLNSKGEKIETHSYQSFQDRVDSIAFHLLKASSLKTGDRVILAYPPGLEMIAAFVACSKIGLVPVPVAPPSENNFYAAFKKMVYIANDSQAKAIFTTRKYYWFFQLNFAKQQLNTFFTTIKLPPKTEWIKTDEYSDVPKFDIPQTPFDFLFLQYTSGSTNEPKGVMVSHENVCHNANEAIEHEHPIGVSWLPQFHDMGLIGYYLFILIKGGTTYGFSPLDFLKNPMLWLQSISRYQATISSAPNFAYEYCLREDKIAPETLASTNLNLQSLRVLMSAAEPVRASTFHRFFDRFERFGLSKQAFSAAYGLAENTIAVTMNGHRSLSLRQNLLLQNVVKEAERKEEKTTQLISCGKPLGGVSVKIVHPDRHQALPAGEIGEVWVAGNSKCLGYWNRKEQSEQAFFAKIKGDKATGERFLRTGDLGFFYEDELYICGRIKDMIIIRGANYFPQDIEQIIEENHPEIRKGALACVSLEVEKEERLAIFMEAKNPVQVPDFESIAKNIRSHFNLSPYLLAFLPPRSIPKTTSGKIARSLCKRNYLEDKLPISNHQIFKVVKAENQSLFEDLKTEYKLSGKENCNLFEAGLDSLEMVSLIGKIQHLLEKEGAKDMAQSIDMRLFHNLTVADLFNFIQQLKACPKIAISFFKEQLDLLKEEQQAFEQARMKQDSQLPIPQIATGTPPKQAQNIFLTGGTGFLGPFLVASLLEQSTANIYILTRAKNVEHAQSRLKEALFKSKLLTGALLRDFNSRVKPVCGDLAMPNLGLKKDLWLHLAQKIDTIYHNGALVNYILGYEDMRAVNVLGTQEMLRFAMSKRPKIFHHISTTFIFGWSVKPVLYETDNNEDMNALDFGYSQSKWVSEQLVLRAFEKGLKGCLFRPSLIAPSTNGGGYHFDIAMRLFAFMINKGVSATAGNQMSLTPADIVANNIVAISNMPDSLGKTFHIAADDYYNLMDITEIIGDLRGQKFRYASLRGFMKVLKTKCQPDDLVYPLLDFFIRSTDRIAAMEFKRYNCDNYQNARAASPFGRADISLRKTVHSIIQFLEKEGVIEEVGEYAEV